MYTLTLVLALHVGLIRIKLNIITTHGSILHMEVHSIATFLPHQHSISYAVGVGGIVLNSFKKTYLKKHQQILFI